MRLSRPKGGAETEPRSLLRWMQIRVVCMSDFLDLESETRGTRLRLISMFSGFLIEEGMPRIAD